MNKKTKIGIGIGICLAYLIAIIAVPLSSYLKYNSEVNNLISSKVETDNQTLKELNFKLKEGVVYYDNGKSFPSKNDFIVEAVYGGTYADPKVIILDNEDYELNVPSTFARLGGDITIKYQNKTATKKLELQKVVPTSLVIAEQPYLVTYAVNDVFSSDGMKVEVKYNDGSTKTVKNYVILNKNALTKNDKEVEISYTEGDIILTTKCPINVVDIVNNGEAKSLYVSEVSLLAGTKLTALDEVLGVYENGNKWLIEASEYAIISDEVAELGKEYDAKVELISNSSVWCDIPVSVYAQIEGENTTGVNITNTKVVDNYIIDEDGNIVKNGTVIVNNGGFKTDLAENYEKNKSMDIKFNASAHTNAELTIRAANYNWSGTDMDMAYFENMFDIYVNGRLTSFAPEAIIPGFFVPQEVVNREGIKAQDIGYNVFFDIKLADVNLLNGENVVTIKLSFDETVITNTFSETADIKMDYFRVAVDSDVPQHILHEEKDVQSSCVALGVIGHLKCDTCGETYKNNECTEIILDTSIPTSDHDLGDYQKDVEKHYQVCKNCSAKIESNHNFEITEHNASGHTKECFCGQKVSEIHNYKVKAYSTKVYNQGDALDSSAFVLSKVCECNQLSDFNGNYNVAFNEKIASRKTIATITCGEEICEVNIPVNLKLQAETFQETGDANYKLSMTYTLVEEGKGSDGTASVGIQSENGNPKKPELQNSTITLTIKSDTDRTINLSMKAASCYNANQAFLLENAADLIVNGENQNFASDAEFKGSSTKWFGWEDVNIANINLKEGVNTIVIQINYNLTLMPEHTSSGGDGPFNMDFFNVNYL